MGLDTYQSLQCAAVQVKGDVYELIDVPVRRQRWTGWPTFVDDDTVSE